MKEEISHLFGIIIAGAYENIAENMTHCGFQFGCILDQILRYENVLLPYLKCPSVGKENKHKTTNNTHPLLIITAYVLIIAEPHLKRPAIMTPRLICKT